MLNTIIDLINRIAAGWFSFSTAMLLQSSILITVIFLIDLLIRKRVRAVVRYWIWLLVLAKLALPTTLALPTGIGRLFPDTVSPVHVAQPSGGMARSEQRERGHVNNSASQRDSSVSPEGATGWQPPKVDGDFSLNQKLITNNQQPSLSWQSLLFLAWLTGMLILAIIVIQRMFFVRTLIAQSLPAEGRLAEVLAECCEKMNMRRLTWHGRLAHVLSSVRTTHSSLPDSLPCPDLTTLPVDLRLTKNVLSPAACGLLRPIILMPESLIENLSQPKLRVILTHELVHIKRGDLWLNLIQTILQIAYFYNPLLWLANAAIRRVREQAVDESAIVNLNKWVTGKWGLAQASPPLAGETSLSPFFEDTAKNYAATLVDIAELALSRPHFSLRLVGVVESKKSLAGRIKHIISRPIPKSAKLGLLGILAVIVIGVVLLPMAKAKSVAQNQQPATEKNYAKTEGVGQKAEGKIASELKKGHELNDSNGHHKNADGNVFTLSEIGLMSLDWDCSTWFSTPTKAKVIAKRAVPGRGVEYDVYFPVDCDVNNGGWVFYGTSAYGGAATFTGLNTTGLRSFDLQIALVAINDSNNFPATVPQIYAGAFIGNSGREYYYWYTSLHPGKAAIASVPVSGDIINSVGFVMKIGPRKDFEIDPKLGLKITILISSSPGAIIFDPPKLTVTSSAILAHNGKELVVGEPYKTIQDAINAAKSGETVRVKSGIYDETITLKDGVSLIGETNSIIQYNIREASVVSLEHCSGNKISGLALRHVGGEDLQEGRWSVINADHSNVHIDNCTIENGACEGIRIDGGRAVISGCTIRKNRNSGIRICGDAKVEVKNNICAENKRNGIYFEYLTSGTVQDNNCSGNGKYGISIFGEASAIVRNNKCSENKFDGIFLWSEKRCTAMGNLCRQNIKQGINAGGTGEYIIIENTCVRNGFNGMFLCAGSSGTVRGNKCAMNDWNGISIEVGASPSVQDNECIGNTRCGIYLSEYAKTPIGLNTYRDNGCINYAEICTSIAAARFAELENIATKLRNEKRRFKDGNWQITEFYEACGNHNWPGHIPKMDEQWTKSRPDSSTAKIGLAHAYIRAAWNARGSGWGRNVPSAIWKVFEENLQKAEAVLIEAETTGAKDPELYAAWLTVGMGMSKSNEEMDDIFKKGIAVEPTYYPLYTNRAQALLPRWHGKPGDFEKFARQAIESSKRDEGNALYYIVARSVIGQVDVNEFKGMGFSYDLLRQGQKDLEIRYQEARDGNISLFIACAFDDKERAKDCLIEIGSGWSNNIWKTQETFEKYRRWAIEKDSISEPNNVLDSNTDPNQQWRQKFDAVYHLDQGQILKRIAPPFIPERKEYYQKEMAKQAAGSPRPPTFLIFKANEKLESIALGYMPEKYPLWLALCYILGVNPNRSSDAIDGSKELLEFQIDGDWILRDGATPEQILAALEEILKNDFGKNIHFVKRQNKWFVEEPNSLPINKTNTEQYGTRHFVRVVIDNSKNKMTFEGENVNNDTLPAALKKVADRAHTVLEIAFAPGTAPEPNSAAWVAVVQGMDDLKKRFGYEYISLVGEHPLGSKGGSPEKYSVSIPAKITPAFKMEISEPILTPDGQPADSAQVIYYQADGVVPQIENGKLISVSGVDIYETSADGRISFPQLQGTRNSKIFILHKSGYANPAMDMLTAKGVNLSPWSSLEGTYFSAGKPATGVEVSYNYLGSPDPNMRRPWIRGYAVTSTTGQFRFDRLMPGMGTINAKLKTQDGKEIGLNNYSVEIKPGANSGSFTRTGRPIIGKIILNPNLETKTYSFSHSVATFDALPRKAFPYPVDFNSFTASQKQKWHNEFRSSKEFKDFFNNVMAKYPSFTVPVQPDGTFKILDVPAGQYEAKFILRLSDGAYDTPIAYAAKEVVVAEIEQDKIEKPLDLGLIQLQKLPDKVR